VVRVEPAVVGVASFVASAYGQHIVPVLPVPVSPDAG
jgi:hypothetical protein